VTPSIRRTLAAVVAAVLVAGAAYLATTVLYAAASGGTPAALGATFAYFALPAVVTAVLLAILIAVERFRRPWLTVLLGLLAAALGNDLGTALTLLLQGNPISGAVLAYAAESALGYGALFEGAAAALLIPIGRTVQRRFAGSGAGRRIALVRSPSRTEAVVDDELLVRQWRDYVAAIEAAGWQVREVPADPEQPDALFVEDIAVVVGSTAVVCHPGEERRRAEIPAVRDALAGAGLRLAAIEWPGTLDGGDVVQLGATVYVGRGPHTNAEGVRQLRTIVAAQGRQLLALPASKRPRLGTVVSPLPDGTVAVPARGFAEAALFDRVRPMPEAAGTRVLALGGDTVLVPASAPETARRFTDLGWHVVVVDISELEKIDASVRRMAVLVP